MPKLSQSERQAVLDESPFDIGDNHICQTILAACQAAMGDAAGTAGTSGIEESSAKRHGLPEIRQHRATAVSSVSRGIIIRASPLELILSGKKSWEMRTSHTNIRETIALIRKSSKAVFGVADIVDSRGPLTQAEMKNSLALHAIEVHRLDDPAVVKNRFAWILRNVRRLPVPVPYDHKGGVRFVSLDAVCVQKLTSVLASL
jgi:hypothetical protein